MAPGNAHARRKKPKPENPKILKRKREAEDLDELSRKIAELDSKELSSTFSELPLSQPTQSGLEASHFKTLTDIQSKSILTSLKGKDVLGAAKTGSGKTLAFLVPVLENLYRQRWTEFDGLGALILSPTRELAIQIFEVLRKIGRYHTFSAGLVIGGKSLQEERDRLGRMNILVCTPGRMLQHMDQTAAFEVDNLQMLVLDEADRILDMGFQSTVDAIVEHLPKDRQTLLFSATQTKKISDLARLSLQDPEYVAVHEAAASATPSTLQQHYVVTPLQDKLDTLWSFTRANLKAKILVFLSSGKQVRFVYEAFRQLQPGIPLLHLLGKQRQTARYDITTRFSSNKNCCLLATDVAARGLDFPAVDWVIQFDCPEDSDTYIHRVGRTARYERDGRAVLFLDPSEKEGMLQRLEQKRVPIEEIKVRQKKQQSIKPQLQNMCFKDVDLKYLGQKAFISYVKSIYVQKDKDIFDIKKLPLEEFSSSLGLPGAPRIKFMRGDDAKKLKNQSRRELYDSEDDKDGHSKKEVRTKYDRMFERRNQDVLADHRSNIVNHNDHPEDQTRDADEDDDFMTVKRHLSNATPESDEKLRNSTGDIKSVKMEGREPLLIDSKRRGKMLKSKKAMLKTKGQAHKLIFDDEGKAHELYELEDEEGFKRKGTASAQRAQFLQVEGERTKSADVGDKLAAKEKKKEKKAKRKAREAAERELHDEYGDEEPEVQLAPFVEPEEMSDGPASPLPKRSRKWFEQDPDTEPRKQSHGHGVVEDADTLEDLEQIATSVL